MAQHGGAFKKDAAVLSQLAHQHLGRVRETGRQIPQQRFQLLVGGDSALQGIFTRALQPREERGEQPRPGHALQGGRGAVRAEHFEKLLADAFAGGPGDPVGIAADGGEGSRFDAETEAGLQPKGPDEPHRVVPERGGGHHADGPGVEILPTAGDVDDRARGDIEREGVDGEIPVAQVHPQCWLRRRRTRR